jgi:hypothetical protein
MRPLLPNNISCQVHPLANARSEVVKWLRLKEIPSTAVKFEIP